MRVLTILVILALTISVVCSTSPVVADNQDVGPAGSNIWVNVGFGSTSWINIGLGASIDRTPDSWNVGVVAEGATPSTGINNFTVTNSSGFAVNITIHGTDLTGGTTWTLSDDGGADVNIVGLMTGLDDGDDNYDIVIRKNAPYNVLVSGLAGGGGTQDWGMQMFVPTDYADESDGKSGTVTITGVVP